MRHDLIKADAVSIHAPVRGGDSMPVKPFVYQESFNPRPRARGRHYIRDIFMEPVVSIHAPVRGGDP